MQQPFSASHVFIDCEQVCGFLETVERNESLENLHMTQACEVLWRNGPCFPTNTSISTGEQEL